jgi:hypothetical protein
MARVIVGVVLSGDLGTGLGIGLDWITRLDGFYVGFMTGLDGLHRWMDHHLPGHT